MRPMRATMNNPNWIKKSYVTYCIGNTPFFKGQPHPLEMDYITVAKIMQVKVSNKIVLAMPDFRNYACIVSSGTYRFNASSNMYFSLLSKESV